MWQPVIDFPFTFSPSTVLPRRSFLKSLTAIQRASLWNGSQDQSKIKWVAWESICHLKAAGGLKIKDLDRFNKCLLSKWL